MREQLLLGDDVLFALVSLHTKSTESVLTNLERMCFDKNFIVSICLTHAALSLVESEVEHSGKQSHRSALEKYKALARSQGSLLTFGALVSERRANLLKSRAIFRNGGRAFEKGNSNPKSIKPHDDIMEDDLWHLAVADQHGCIYVTEITPILRQFSLQCFTAQLYDPWSDERIVSN